MASEGIERSIVATIRRISGRAETTRSARSRRASRATVAKGPATGRSESATIVKSKIHELNQFGEGTLAVQQDASPSEMLDSLLANGVKLDFALKAVSLAMVERDLTPIGLRNRLRERGVPDRHWYELKRFRRLPPSTRTGSESVVDLLRRSVAEFKPIRLTPSPDRAMPLREYYSDTFAGFSVIPELIQQPEATPGSESPFVPLS